MSIYNINGNNISSSGCMPNTIIVAASDASTADKECANYICDGTNDEVEIQNAVNDIANNGGEGNIVFTVGNFYIDRFYTYSDANMKTAILIPTTVSRINFRGSVDSSNPANIGTGSRLNVTATGLTFVTEQSALFHAATRGQGYLCANYSGMYIEVADIAHPIICINNYYASASIVENMRIRQLGKGAGNIPAQGSVGIRCSRGNNAGIGLEIRQVSCSGFYEGFQLGGEHLVLTGCLGHDCYYSYTFGNYAYNVGVMEHPITLINCADELSAALPLFNRCGDYSQSNKYGKQLVTFIDYNMELRPTQNPTLSAVLPAEEVTEGAFCGSITFAANNQPRSYYNIPNVQFWKEGSGKNFKTVNAVHKLGGTTAERNTYTPQYMQQYFDTDLNKMLIYDGSAWKDMNGTSV